MLSRLAGIGAITLVFLSMGAMAFQGYWEFLVANFGGWPQ